MSGKTLASRQQRAALAELLRERASRPRSYPLCSAQQGIWLTQQLAPAAPVFNMFQAVHLEGALSMAALERTLNEILRRQGALRTTIRSGEHGLVQVVDPPRPRSWPLIDLGALPAHRREPAARRLAGAESRRPFDLARGPLLRAVVLRLGAAEHVLLLNMHHVIADHWSAKVLTRELATLYTAFAAGKPSPLPEPALQYGSFAVWQKKRFEEGQSDAQMTYWQERLAGLRTLELPTDRPRPASRSFQGAAESLRFRGAVIDAVREIHRRERVTVSTLFLALLQMLLYRYTGQDDVAVIAPVAIRNRPEIEDLIGLFLNMVILRTDLSGDPTFSELLARVGKVAMEAYTHQDLPFERIVEELRPQWQPSRPPLTPVAYNFRAAPEAATTLPGLTWSTREQEAGSTRFDVELTLWEEPAGVSGMIIYDTALFEAATVARMRDHLHRLLRGIADDPEQRISTLMQSIPAAEIPAGAAPAASPVRDREAAPEPVAPATPLEQEVASIVRSILAVDRIGVHDNLIYLGVDSLRAMQILVKLTGTFAVDVSLADIMQQPTVAELAQMIREQQAERAGSLDELLAELDQISDEEAERILAREKATHA